MGVIENEWASGDGRWMDVPAAALALPADPVVTPPGPMTVKVAGPLAVAASG